jgi:hypothetical protein
MRLRYAFTAFLLASTLIGVTHFLYSPAPVGLQISGAPIIAASIKGVAIKGDASEQVLDQHEHPRKLMQMIQTAHQAAVLTAERIRSSHNEVQDTPDNALLNKALRFLKAAQDLSGIKSGFPADAELIGYLSIPNTETQVLSLELLLARPASENTRSEILAQAPLVKNDAKPLFFEIMEAETRGSSASHAEFMNTLLQSLQSDDINTVALTVQKLDRLSLTEDEFNRTVSSLCYIKKSPDLNRNWNEINSHLVEYHETRAFNDASPSQICGS